MPLLCKLTLMHRLLWLLWIIPAGILFSCSAKKKVENPQVICECDTLSARQIITARDFNRFPLYDTSSFKEDNFYELDSAINRSLWYRDIENTDTTKFTRLWNAYYPENYYASQADFVHYYAGRPDIEMAFQLGPNHDLWAYHTFVFKRIGCCYLATRSYYRHARFTYKAYAVVNEKKIDTLYSILGTINKSGIDSSNVLSYIGAFADNRNNKKFKIDFEKEKEPVKSEKEDAPPCKEVLEFYEFIDKRIGWIITYKL